MWCDVINSNKIKDAQKNLLIESFGMCEQKVVKQGLIIDEQKNQLNTKDKIIIEQKKQLRSEKRKKIVGGVLGFGLGVIGGVVAGAYLINWCKMKYIISKEQLNILNESIRDKLTSKTNSIEKLTLIENILTNSIRRSISYWANEVAIWPK